MLAAIISKVSCACGWSGELCFSAREKWKRRCPGCKKPVVRGQSASAPRFHGNRRFAGSESESITKGFHPKEVKFIKAQMPGVQHCINDTGDVSFADRAEERKFDREYAAMADRLGGLPDPEAGGDMMEV